MTNVEIIREYYRKFFSGKARHSEVRALLTDDFTLRDPLMSATGADDYLRQLSSLGDDLEMHAEVRDIVGQGDKVAALVDFQAPQGVVQYAQWFELMDGKIKGIESIYDPRLFLEGSPGEK